MTQLQPLQRWAWLLWTAALTACSADCSRGTARFDPSVYASGPSRSIANLLVDEPALEPAPQHKVYAVLRAGGLRLADGWFEVDGDYRSATMLALDSLTHRAGEAAARADALELCLPHSFTKVAMSREGAAVGNVHRGVRGLRLRWKERERWTCPTETIADNRALDKVEEAFRREQKLDLDRYVREVEAQTFEAHQLLLRLGAKPHLDRMFRGNTVVPMEAVTRASSLALMEGMERWLVGQVHPDGRATYLYWPSRGEESPDNNMIRQFMASVCLVRLAKLRGETASIELAKRNLRYNLDRYYRDDGELGVITFRGESKLGAAALAALAIIEAPFRAEFAEQERRLVALTEHMQRPDGSFSTFYGSDREDNQNFYPGEVLLTWATLLDQTPDPAREARFMRAFAYYRSWHREQVNPAFIPWHTQAYYLRWAQTKSPELREFVFEMNDFLSDYQEWTQAVYPDTKGRFYDDGRREFGPPHASSTGVYLEGLVDAYRMAREAGDHDREQRYCTAILRGLRNLMQLQFVDDVDTYYVSKKDRVLGGIRTTEYDNAIRIDNVQHSLMALMKIVPAFDESGAWQRCSGLR